MVDRRISTAYALIMAAARYSVRQSRIVPAAPY